MERTPYKDTYYVWSVICPSWHVGKSPKLDYSRRLCNGEYFVGTADDIAEQVIQAVEVDLDARQRCCGPPIQSADLVKSLGGSSVNLSKIELETHNNLTHIFDKGILSLLAGDEKNALEALNIYQRRGGDRDERYGHITTELLLALQTENKSWINIIQKAERRGREAMGLV